jgi:hypothetical protein
MLLLVRDVCVTLTAPRARVLVSLVRWIAVEVDS